MRPFLAIVAGFVLTLVVFGSGTAFGTFMLAGKSVQEVRASVDAADVWTSEPRRVDTATQDLERLPPQTAQPDPAAEETSPLVAQADMEATDDAETIDVTTTASIQPPDSDVALAADPEQTGRDREMPVELVEAHIEWCASRYRSYRPRDDSYTPYSGGRRPCISPYSETLDAIMGPVSSPSPIAEHENRGMAPVLGYASDDRRNTRLSDDHVRSCFNRYRSYRPEDNSYQPYGGGPRRQCGASPGRGGSSGQDHVRPRRSASATALVSTQRARPGTGRERRGRAAFDPHRGGR